MPPSRYATQLRRRKLFRQSLFAICICAILQIGMHSAITTHRQTTLISTREFASYTSLEDIGERAKRFPSMESRVKLYMSSWYLPPCAIEDEIAFAIDQKGDYTVHVNTSEVLLSRQPELSKRVFRLDQQSMEHCSMESNQNRFCDDAVRYYLPSLKRLESRGLLSTHIGPPFILQFGDAEEWILPKWQNESAKLNYPRIPVLKKFRFALDSATIHQLTDNNHNSSSSGCKTLDDRVAQAIRGPQHTQAIITIVSNVHRHFGPLDAIPTIDIPWEQKINRAVYRGGLTGRNQRTLHHHGAGNITLTSGQRCEEIPRCNFVLNHADSKVVDAKLVEIKQGKDLDLHSIDGIQLFGETLSMEQMLRYKVIVMLEGNGSFNSAFSIELP